MVQSANQSLHWIEHHGVGWLAEFREWYEFGRWLNTIESVCYKTTASGIMRGWFNFSFGRIS